MGKWAEALRNIRIGDEVKEEERDYSKCWPEDVLDAASQGILRYWRYCQIFLSIWNNVVRAESVYLCMLWVKVQFKGGNSDHPIR